MACTHLRLWPSAYPAAKALVLLSLLSSSCLVQQLPAQGQVTMFFRNQIFSRITSGSPCALAPLPEPDVFPDLSSALGDQTASRGEFSPARLSTSLIKAPLPLSFDPCHVSDLSLRIGGSSSGPVRADGLEVFISPPFRVAFQDQEPCFPLISTASCRMPVPAQERSTSTLFPPAVLSRIRRVNLDLPFRSTLAALRFDYDDNRWPHVAAGLGGGSASAMFTSSTLRNGMIVSAGASFGAPPALFPAKRIRSLSSPAQNGLVSSLAIKVSF